MSLPEVTVPNYELDATFYHGLEDFTFFADVTKLKQLFGQTYSKEVSSNLQWDETVCLRPKAYKTSVVGRLNVSRCFAGKSISCSFRLTGRPSEEKISQYHIDYHIEKSGYNPSPLGDPKHLNSVEDLCDVIHKRIFPSSLDVHGLIVISGATASGKSKIARGLIYKYLESLLRRNGSGRRPHLVTCEDPIDKYWAENSEAAKDTGVDYTPRELAKDVGSLKQAVEAALRQTPKVFFVGETRQPRDWKVLLEFASTGHVGVTTSHAGSLTEAMEQLFHAANASTPAQRSEVANRILALVHLRTKRVGTQPDEDSGGVNITIPAVWVRSAISTKTLMADGLTSLLPHRDAVGWDERLGTAGALGCLGRSWFAELLLRRALTKTEIRPTIAGEIERTALSWDLEGL